MDHYLLNALKTVTENLDQGDNELATRLLLDLFTEADRYPELFNEAVQLRARYNKLEQNGLPESELHKLAQDLKELVQQLERKLNPETLPLPADPLQRPGLLLPVLEAENITHRFAKGGFFLGPLTLKLYPGQITGVVGENGNGKTTLLRIIAGELARAGGKLAFPNIADMRQVEQLNWALLKQHIAYIPQRVPKWYGLLKQNLHLEATAHGIKGDENKERVDYIIHRLGLTKYANARWSEISSGYKLRFELARALLWRPNLLVLDEPLANLDIKAQQLLLQDLKLLVQTRRYPLSILLTSQQLYELEQVTDQLVFLEQGKPRFVGSTAQLAQHWQEQAFEVAGDFTRAQLYDALKDFADVRVEDSGQYFTVYCSEQLKQSVFMEQVGQLGDLSYFRNISKSSRRLFG